MITQWITSKTLPWIGGGLAVAIGALILTTYLLYTQKQYLEEQLVSVTQENLQLTESMRQQSQDYQRLSKELQRRDALITKTQIAKQQMEREARETISSLRQALASDPCAGTAHPDAVTDSLRSEATDPAPD